MAEGRLMNWSFSLGRPLSTQMGQPRTLLRLSILVLLLSLLELSSFTAADDAAVMAKLLAALSPAPSDWSTSTDPCMWEYVKCDNRGRVTVINLTDQSLSGTLPSDLGTLTQLSSLFLEGNSFSGPLPSLANLSSLERLYLGSNNFISIPAGFFQGLTSLQTLNLSANADLAPWTIPTDLTRATSLVNLYASGANVVGSLPEIFHSFPSLKDLQLSSNNLTGTLPKSLGGSAIENLSLDNQVIGLSGTIDVLSSMTQLTQVWLFKNQFTGPIPDLSRCTSLFDLQLRDNQFTGLVPESLMSISSLSNISLDNNDLQGPFPTFPSTVTTVSNDGTNSFCKSTPGPCDSQVTTLLEIAAALGYPIKLASSWQGNDACDGWTFITCDSQKKIIGVYFAKQGFAGTISAAFSNLTSLRNLNLNDNKLKGAIPDSLATLPSLQILDVSNNDLTGSIPKFATTVKFTSTGNPLLGKTTTGSGSGGGSSSGLDGITPGGSPAGAASAATSISPGIIAGIVIAVVIFVAVVLFLSIKCYVGRLHRKNGSAQNPENGKESSGDLSDLQMFEGGNVISIQVLRQATNHFSEDNILGRGGFGVVYKGELPDGTKIAVKKMEIATNGSRGVKEFRAEISILTKVRHKHLVALLGYCVNGNERLLVYEYMPRGNLTHHLFGWRERGYSPLTWKQRLAIALDVARGLEYLHSLTQQSFIHRDLKPCNILLGDDMRAKVADFGLVKNVPDGKHSLETRLAGTFGYVAPEYGETGRVTTKVDVYAFGVVLTVLITGKKAVVDSGPDEKSHLVTWFLEVVKETDNIPKAIDQTLEFNEETMESINKVIELIGHCFARNPSQRPSMGHVVNILSPLVEQWEPEVKESNGLDLISEPSSISSQTHSGAESFISMDRR